MAFISEERGQAAFMTGIFSQDRNNMIPLQYLSMLLNHFSYEVVHWYSIVATA